MTSCGQRLLHEKGLRQGAYFPASSIDQERRQEWITSRPDPKRRVWKSTKRVLDDNIFVVLSQDCDIACSEDSVDPLVELAVCSEITTPHNRSTFAYSARTIHFEVDTKWYEAKVTNIVFVHKSDLAECLQPELIQHLTDSARKTLPQWRALRYQRVALPDQFNQTFKPLEDHIAEKLDGIGREHVRALYLWLDSYDEKDSYEFELFALLQPDTPDENLHLAIDVIEELNGLLESEGVGRARDADDVWYAARTDQIYVNHLLKFDRINFDSLSLEIGDDDVEVETGA